MRVSLTWLAEFVDLPPDGELVDRLNLGGFEDAEIESLGPDLTGVVVGHVREREPHPNADRLSLCRVDVGGEVLEIVCGAPNVAAGQRVAVAPAGTALPDGTKLKRTKIRGVVSNGMICSATELGLGGESDGILVLDPEAPVGAPLDRAIAVGDRVLEVGITPNRGDTASLLGLAREIHALLGGAVRLPETAAPESGPPASDAVRVDIAARDACHHYVARIVRGVRVGPSPAWLAAKLEASGIRSINNVVDVTNLVLLEFGQPLHAFDLDQLRGGRVEVRMAHAGEKLACLDGETRELSPRDLVIGDGERAIALAGVMGGADTEVGPGTRDVLIESAHFHPTAVRLAARRHGLHTEASYRFERGVDREGVARAADRAARLMAELAGGAVAAGVVEARGEPPAVCGSIRFDVPRANRLLGTQIARDEAAGLLERVGLGCEPADADVLVCRVPSHRNDLWLPQDVTEELARVFGYDRIPVTMPTGELVPASRPALWDRVERVKDAMAAAGATEVVSLPFAPPGDCDALGLAADDPRRRGLTVVNPIREEEPGLRTLLLPSLLRILHQNLSRQQDGVRVFEVAPVFRAAAGSGPLREPIQLAAAWTRPAQSSLWAPERRPPLFFEAKGLAERLLIQAGYVASLQREAASPYLHPGASVAIDVGEIEVGAVGELHPGVAARFGLEEPVAVIEIDLSRLDDVPPRVPRFREVSRLPQVQRDLAVLVDTGVRAGEVLAAVEQAAGGDLVHAEIFDRYEGRGVPEGRVSLAFRLVFQRVDRTLTEKEVTKATDRVVRMLAHRFGGELRQG